MFGNRCESYRKLLYRLQLARCNKTKNKKKTKKKNKKKLRKKRKKIEKKIRPLKNNQCLLSGKGWRRHHI
jgi:hypothetical protein